MNKTFPTGFLWGVATAAHQVEGGNDNCDTWAEEWAEGSPYVDKSGDAIEHYQRFRDDIALLASLGLKAYRFSIEWARVEPREGEFSAEALAHYRAVVDACVEHGLEPLVTLHHFTSPKWLMALGGWRGERTPELFARYVEQVMPALGPAVKRVVTLNECNIGVLLQSMFASLGFVPPIGVDVKSWRAPGWRDSAAKACGTDPATYCAFQMAGDDLGVRTISNAHMAARAVIRRVAPSVQVGLALALSQPQHVKGGEEGAARMWHGNFRQWLPAIEGDDFFALQNYTREIHGPDGQIAPPEGAEMTGARYEFVPQAVASVARRVAHELKLPILITENGYCGDDDTRRVEFLQQALAGLHAAIADGVPLIGYTCWTAFDNFEWVFGYGMRFGLIAVDRTTQRRTPKPSALLLGGIARANALPDGIVIQPQPGTAQELAMNHVYTPPAAEPGTVFTNVRIFDGSGSAAVAGELRVDGRRITAVAAC